MDGFESLDSPSSSSSSEGEINRRVAPPARDHSKQSALFRLDGMGLLVIDVTTLIVP